jgi:hypothetical protein
MANDTIEYRDPKSLVQTDWLEAHLGDPPCAYLRLHDIFEACGTRQRYAVPRG